MTDHVIDAEKAKLDCVRLMNRSVDLLLAAEVNTPARELADSCRETAKELRLLAVFLTQGSTSKAEQDRLRRESAPPPPPPPKYRGKPRPRAPMELQSDNAFLLPAGKDEFEP